MNNLINQMREDAGSTAQDNMGKIGAVANDIADTDKEISDIEDQLKKKKDYKKHLSENVLPNLFSEVGLSELKLADGRHLKVSNFYGASIKEAKKVPVENIANAIDIFACLIDSKNVIQCKAIIIPAIENLIKVLKSIVILTFLSFIKSNIKTEAITILYQTKGTALIDISSPKIAVNPAINTRK